jgi:hypothetical protein
LGWLQARAVSFRCPRFGDTLVGIGWPDEKGDRHHKRSFTAGGQRIMAKVLIIVGDASETVDTLWPVKKLGLTRHLCAGLFPFHFFTDLKTLQNTAFFVEEENLRRGSFQGFDSPG